MPVRFFALCLVLCFLNAFTISTYIAHTPLVTRSIPLEMTARTLYQTCNRPSSPEYPLQRYRKPFKLVCLQYFVTTVVAFVPDSLLSCPEKACMSHDFVSRLVIYGPGSAKKPTIWPSFLGPAAAIIRGLSSSLRLSTSWAHASLQATASHVLIGTYTLCRH